MSPNYYSLLINFTLNNIRRPIQYTLPWWQQRDTIFSVNHHKLLEISIRNPVNIPNLKIKHLHNLFCWGHIVLQQNTYYVVLKILQGLLLEIKTICSICVYWILLKEYNEYTIHSRVNLVGTLFFYKLVFGLII